MLSQVLRPIITAFVFYKPVRIGVQALEEMPTPGLARLVTRAKYAISFLSPVQGSVPPRPIPILVVAATINVSSRGIIVELLPIAADFDSTELDIALGKKKLCRGK
jgi:hypothetical protein